MLRTHRDALDRLAAALLAQETIDGEVVLDVLAAEQSAGAEQARTPPVVVGPT